MKFDIQDYNIKRFLGSGNNAYNYLIVKSKITFKFQFLC